MASLKDLGLSLPQGLVFTPDGARALESQINTKITEKKTPLYDDYYEETKKIAIELADKLNKLLNSIGKAPKPVISKKLGLTISDPIEGDFHRDTGLLLASTGFMILLDNVVIYKKNGRIHYKKASKINKTALSASLTDLDESTNLTSKRKNKVVLWLDVILFSNSDYSTSVNYGLGTQRWDGKEKQGIGWFSKLEHEFGVTFRSVMGKQLGLSTTEGYENTSYNYSLTKQHFIK